MGFGGFCPTGGPGRGCGGLAPPPPLPPHASSNPPGDASPLPTCTGGFGAIPR